MSEGASGKEGTEMGEETGREVVNEWLEIGNSGIHGRGGYARAKIQSGVNVVEYVGDKVTKEESGRLCVAGNPFVFTVNDDYDINGDVPWNPARFLNHSCAPNCEAQQDDENRIGIVALRDIGQGEELTFNYGYDLSEWRDYPCRCGAASCLGFIVAAEHHAEVGRIIAAEAAEARPCVDSGSRG